MHNYLFIDKEVGITTGDEAKKLLEQKNDSEFMSEHAGVIKVTKDRWHEAQEAEYTHWFKNGLFSTDDHNFAHMKKFDMYSMIKGLSFESSIELGCGPFTNIGIIANFVDIKSVSLLDPLLNHYLRHPFVSYDEKRILIRPLREQFRSWRVFVKMLRVFSSLKHLLYRKLPITDLFTCGIEDMNTINTYDLVVVINVLEHCFDIDLVFNKILSILRPDGILVFHDKYYYKENVKNIVSTYYDAAHPLKVDGKIIDEFLNSNFSMIYKRVDVLDEVWQGIREIRDLVYYVGRRKSPERTGFSVPLSEVATA